MPDVYLGAKITRRHKDFIMCYLFPIHTRLNTSEYECSTCGVHHVNVVFIVVHFYSVHTMRVCTYLATPAYACLYRKLSVCIDSKPHVCKCTVCARSADNSMLYKKAIYIFHFFLSIDAYGFWQKEYYYCKEERIDICLV